MLCFLLFLQDEVTGAMANVECLEALDLQPSKRRKLTNFNKCIICQVATQECLRKPKESSIQTLVAALKVRQDDVYERLRSDLDSLSSSSVQWHSKCYAKWTSKENLRYKQVSLSSTTLSDSAGTSRKSRGQCTPTDWTKCLFCKRLTHKKVKEMFRVSTFQACETIMQAAIAKGDDDLLRVTRAVNNDLIAAEARYHKICHASYISKANLMSAAFHEGGQETTYDAVFRELADQITMELQHGKAFETSALLIRYKAMLQEQGGIGESYTCQRLKLRLKKYFGDDIVFHQPHDRTKSELLYSSSISIKDILNSAYQSNSGISEHPPTVAGEHEGDPVRLLYQTAKLIKSEINDCQGISLRPPNISDFSLTKSKSLIPDKLYWLLRWIITNSDKEGEGDLSSPECSSSSDERRVVMLAQDIIHCATHACTNMPKHAALGITIHHMTRSKLLITILNRMGHCVSYDNVQVMDTSLAKEIIAKSDLFGVVVPSNIRPGIFVQVAGDNNDMNEETLDGKLTTHATTMVLYQRGKFGPAPMRTVCADHTKRARSLKSTGMCQPMREYSAYGKHPAVTSFLGQVETEWFKCTENLHSAASQVDLAWALVRMTPVKLFEVDLIPKKKQKVPGWSAFHAVVHPHVPTSTNIGYCPMIDGSPTEFSTVYTVMKNVQSMMASLGQKDSVITFDLAIYVKAKEIQWRLKEEFEDTVLRLGGFHIAINYLALLGKKYEMSGIEDLLVESGIYGSSVTTAILKGKSYNRGVRAHKLVMEAMFRLQWCSFVDWLSKQNISDVDQEAVIDHAIDCQMALENGRDVQDAMLKMCDAIATLQSELTRFQHDAQCKSQVFTYWNDYVAMVQLLLEFIKAERTGDWLLHLSATAGMTPHFFSMDRPNYSRWLPAYLADMNQLAKTHPDVHHEFMSGNHAISRSTKPFAQVWTDMALEQSINHDSKTSGGIIGISKRPGALERWFLTCHERAAITTATKDMCGLHDSDRVGTHREGASKRVERDEADIQKLLKVITSGMMTDPFSLDEEEDGALPLVNIATGVVMPSDTASHLLNSYNTGTTQMMEFVEQRLNTNKVKFFDAIPNLKIKTFASLAKKKMVKTADEKVLTVGADRDLFGRLVIAARSRDIDLRDVLSYELTTVPFSLAHPDGSLRKTNKSVLLTELEKRIQVQPSLPRETSGKCSAHLFDAMAMIQVTKFGGVVTFGEMASKLYNKFTAPLGKNGCQRVDVVFDRYVDLSIKTGERRKRGTSAGLQVNIHGPATPVPNQWLKYISNQDNKKNLSAFLADTWCQIGVDSLLDGQELVIGGGFKNSTRSVRIIKGHCEDLANLKSDHEEADTRLLLHAKHASYDHSRIILQSPDTDVAVLCIFHFSSLKCEELWFRTGVKDKVRYLPIHSLAQDLGTHLCRALPGFHALTGCDSNSALSGLGKKKGLSILLQSEEYQCSLGQLGEEPELSSSTSEACEVFVCSVYTTAKKAGRKVNDIRYWLFCQKGQKNESLPPTSDSLVQHMKRANYQSHVWKKALEAIQNLPPPAGHGWIVEGNALQPVLMTKDPAPRGLLELTVCHCRKSACRRADCACRANNMPCTESCSCMAQEMCENQITVADETTDEEDTD